MSKTIFKPPTVFLPTYTRIHIGPDRNSISGFCDICHRPLFNRGCGCARPRLPFGSSEDINANAGQIEFLNPGGSNET